MQPMNYSQNQQHVTEFLNSASFKKLTANQQNHAEAILTRFNHFMEQDEQRDDQHWTVTSLKNVMMGEFAGDHEIANRKFLIAVVPVLKAYQQYLGASNYDQLVRTMADNRTAMQHLSVKRRAADEVVALKQQEHQLTQLPADKEVETNAMLFTNDMRTGLRKRSEFKRIEADEDAKLQIASIFVVDLAKRFQQLPADWDQKAVTTVLMNMLPLDARLELDDAQVFVPVIRSLVNYLSATDQITVKHAAQLLMWLSDCQPVVAQIATMSDGDRHAHALAQLMMHQGVDIDDTDGQAFNKFILDHYDDAIDYMTWLQPWLEEFDDEDNDFDDQDILMGVGDDDDDVSPDQLEQLEEMNRQHVKEVVAEFKQSVNYRQLTRAEQRDAGAIIESVADWTMDTSGDVLDDWSPESIVLVLADIMPAKNSGGRAYFAHVAPVMHQFLQFAIDQDLIFMGREVLDAFERIADQILPNSQNQDNWGPAKQIGMQMMAAGVDPSDQAAVDDFIRQYNDRLQDGSDMATFEKKQPRKVIPFSQKKRGKKKNKKR